MFIIAFCSLAILALLSLLGTHSWKMEFQPMSWRELLSSLAAALAFVFFVYKGSTPQTPVQAGTAAFFAFMIPVIFFGGSSRQNWKRLLVLGLMLGATALRIFQVGCHNGQLAGICASGMIFLMAASTSQTSMTREILPRFFFNSLWKAFPRGFQAISFIFRVPQFNIFSRMGCAAFLVPTFLVFIFGGFFIHANPDLMAHFHTVLGWFGKILQNFGAFISWLFHFFLIGEILVFLCAFCVVCGILAPRTWTLKPQESSQPVNAPTESKQKTTLSAAHIVLYWNTMFVLVILFALNLSYEFHTWLTWTPPVGFNYGAYCHAGALWLTMALVLATLVLAAIFQPKVCQNESVRPLKYLAFIWIVENVLLAGTIYMRLAMYVQQTGLTRLRVIGFFGTTAVAVGLFWMALKLKKNYRVDWLFNGYAWSAAVLFWLYAILPVDQIIWQYNVANIQAGNLSSLVHISEQTISDEGVIPLFTLLQSPEKVIRDGVASVILEHQPKEKSSDWRNFTWLNHQLQILFNEPENQKVLEEARLNKNAAKKMKEYGEKHYK